jgi:hypothetical protein
VELNTSAGNRFHNPLLNRSRRPEQWRDLLLQPAHLSYRLINLIEPPAALIDLRHQVVADVGGHRSLSIDAHLSPL